MLAEGDLLFFRNLLLGNAFKLMKGFTTTSAVELFSHLRQVTEFKCNQDTYYILFYQIIFTIAVVWGGASSLTVKYYKLVKK